MLMNSPIRIVSSVSIDSYMNEIYLSNEENDLRRNNIYKSRLELMES